MEATWRVLSFIGMISHINSEFNHFTIYPREDGEFDSYIQCM